MKEKFINLIKKYGEDILIIGGLIIIVFTTFYVNLIVGWYLAGIVLTGLGIYFAKNPVRKE